MASFIVFWEVIFHCVWEVMLRGCGLFHCVLGGYVERLLSFIVFWEVMLREVVVSFIVF